MRDWQEELAGLSDEQIMLGLKNLPKSWPPTSGEFRDLCERKDNDWQFNTAAYKVFDKSKAIEMKPDKEKAKAEIEKCKKMLNRKK